MKKLIPAILICLLAFAAVPSALAQGTEPQLTLSVSRDFGYGGFDNKIEGLFTISASGPDDLAQVDFYIDDVLMASVSAPPFSHQFSTSEYAPGEHALSAVGTTSSGAQLKSATIVKVFLTKEQSRDATLGLVVPLVAGIFGIMLLAGLITAFTGRGKQFTGSYGMLGGAVCPRCQLPYSLSVWSVHVGFLRLQRCPHCGKWAFVRRARPEDLAAAEARWHGEQEGVDIAEGQAQRTQRQIDDSRFEN